MEILSLQDLLPNSVSYQPRFDEIDYVGNIKLLYQPMLAIFSSAKCPGSLILKAHDYAKEIRDGKMGVISGFHAPAEKEVLAVLLKGKCPLIVVLGRRLKNARIQLVWRAEIEKGRMLIISPFSEKQARVTKELSLKRNDLAARIAGQVLVLHASESGSLQGQIQKWEAEGISIESLA
jgi:predicted Rossmann fold nucleotide-binding protein DprA/Smf involved in DNA uptake